MMAQQSWRLLLGLMVVFTARTLQADPIHVSASGFVSIPKLDLQEAQNSIIATASVNVFPDGGSPAANASAALNGYLATQALVNNPAVGPAQVTATASWDNTFTIGAAGDYSLSFNVQPITLGIDPAALAPSASIDLEVSIHIGGTGGGAGFTTLYRLVYQLDANGLAEVILINGGTNQPVFDDNGKDGTAFAPGYSGTIGLGSFSSGQLVTVQYVLSSQVFSNSVTGGATSTSSVNPTIAQVGDPFTIPSVPQIQLNLNGAAEPTVVPEPSSLFLALTGCVVVGVVRFVQLRAA